jgi:hypothetical protein
MISVLLALGLLEVLLRLFWPQPIIPPMNRRDPQVDKAVRPFLRHVHLLPGEFKYSIYTDRHGFRVPRASMPSRKGPLLAFLGDSFTFGIGVEEEKSFVGLMRSAVAAQGRVINGGVPGTGLTQQLAMYEFVIRDLHPDVVVLAVFPNDLLDCNRVGLYRVNGEGNATYVPGWKNASKVMDHDSPFLRWLQSWSHTYSLVADRLMVRHAVKSHPEVTDDPRVFLACLVRLSRLVAEDGARLYVLTLPGPEDLDQGSNSMRALLEQQCVGETFTLVDPTTALQELNREGGIWFSEGHFDERAHRAVFRVLQSALATGTPLL